MNTTRRRFIESTTAMAAAIFGGCASTKQAGTIAPAKIIDTHVHFYDPSRPQGVPWPPKDDTSLYRTVLPKDYRALPVSQPVNGVVVAEASTWVEDNQWILDLASHDPFIIGLVGNLPVDSAEFGKHFKRFAANPLFCGVRIRHGSLADWLNSPTFINNLRLIADRGLCFDIQSSPAWVAQTDRLTHLVPGLRLIVNHVAGVPVTGGPPPEEWRQMMLTMAEHPEVFMKVSGLVEGTRRTKGDAPVNAEFYQPVLDTLWNIFGPDRLIYGSDWPVSGRFAQLATVQQIATTFFASKGQAALDKIFWKNAQAAYRVDC